MSIEQTYQIIKSRVPKRQVIDSLSVVKQVEEYRQFWKPKIVNVLLLAESHYYTSDEDFEAICKSDVQNRFVMNYPNKFVRFVYCLGYGEPELAEDAENNKRGTPDYWKIFSASVAKSRRDLGFNKVTKENTGFLERIRNKIIVLQEMQRRGIWLLDSSIIGIAGAAMDLDTKGDVIGICWDSRIHSLIADSKPKYLIVIGKGQDSVEEILSDRLEKLRTSSEIGYSSIYQPNYHLTADEREEYFAGIQKVCSKYAP